MNGTPDEYQVTEHALKRLRERWVGVRSLSRKELIELVRDAIQRAASKQQTVKTPGGIYALFSFEGEPGFLVLRNGCVATVLEEEHCPEVKGFLEEHGRYQK